MQKVTISEAKNKLSELIEMAREGEQVIITSGRHHRPVARLLAVPRMNKSRRVPGLFKGVFEIGRNFDAPLGNEFPV